MPHLSSADPQLDLEALQATLQPALDTHGVGLVEMQFRREKPGWVLRVMIEAPTGLEPGAGITLDRCADVSRAISAALDEVDLIRPAYTLEVTSPGIERPLHDEADYRRFATLPAKLWLREAIASGPMTGQKVLEGVLRGVEQGAVQLELALKKGPVAVPVPLGDIKQAHLVYDAAASRKKGPTKGPKPGSSRAKGAAGPNDPETT